MLILVQRQLEDMTTGNCVYLETFLRCANQAGFSARVIFAPEHSFGNRPWASIHPRLVALIELVCWPGAVRLGRRYWSLRPRVWMRFGARLLIEALRRVAVPLTVKSYLGQKIALHEARDVARTATAVGGDIAVAEYSSMAPVLPLIGGMTRACLMHDLLSDRPKRFREAGHADVLDDLPLETELDWLRACDQLYFASANELAFLRPKLPHVRMAWLPPETIDHPIADQPGPPRAVFIGTVHGGNVDALNHFLDEIWPGVTAAVPDAELWIAGSIGRVLSPPKVEQAGVRLLGRVEALATLGGPQSIGVAPARLATGVSIKVAEYLKLGMPSVAYPTALEGFGDALDGLVIRVESPAAFAAAVISLLKDSDKRRQLSDAARRETGKRLNSVAAQALMRDGIRLRDSAA